MKTHYTPSPWHIGKRYPAGAIYDEKGAEICGFSNLLHPAEIAANARLIAAAPELLAALRATLNPLQQAQNRMGCVVASAAFLSARAAIAKAEGEG